MTRADGRAQEELREITVIPDFIPTADGSVLIADQCKAAFQRALRTERVLAFLFAIQPVALLFQRPRAKLTKCRPCFIQRLTTLINRAVNADRYSIAPLEFQTVAFPVQTVQKRMLQTIAQRAER